MKIYQVLMNDGYLNGMTLVRVTEKNIRPLSPELEDELMRAREITLPAEIKYCKWTGDELAAMTEAERAERDVYDEAQAEAAEAARQAAKPAALKEVENNFFALVDALGMTGKPGFAELQDALEALKATDYQTAVDLAVKLLSIDAAGKRYDVKWWDDAARHE